MTGAELLGLLLLLAIAVAVRALVRRGRSEQRLVQSLTPEQLERRRRIKEADKAVKRAKRQHARAVTEAEMAVRNAGKPATLAKVRPVKVTETHIKVDGQTLPLTPTMLFEVQESGAVDVVPVAVVKDGRHRTEMKKIDSRQLFLRVIDPPVSAATEVPSDSREKLLELVARARVAAAEVALTTARLEQERQSAQDMLEAVRADRREVDAAVATREALGPDPLEAMRAARAGERPGMPVIGESWTHRSGTRRAPSDKPSEGAGSA